VTTEEGRNVLFACADVLADLANGYWYPTAKERRPFNHYVKGLRDQDAKGQDGSCYKYGAVSSKLIPGIMGFFCPHGICVGQEFLSLVRYLHAGLTSCTIANHLKLRSRCFSAVCAKVHIVCVCFYAASCSALDCCL
jgi:hypothetical protein